MALTLKELGEARFIGDSDLMIVHDTWHEASENCLLGKLVEQGTAVAFEPDELDQAFWEDYEYCTHCFDRSTPVPPGPYGGARGRSKRRPRDRGKRDIVKAAHVGA